MFKYILLGIAIFLIVMYAIGFFLTPTSCVEIGTCSSCWQPNNVSLTSDYCPNPSVACNAKPIDQQHNAVVDTLFCACNTAKSNNYADKALNDRIEQVFTNFFNKQVSARELCDESSTYLVNVFYD